MAYPFPTTPVILQPDPIPAGTPSPTARTVVNNAINAERIAITTLATDSAALNVAFLGAGRFVSDSNATNGVTAGTGLTLRVPNGTYAIQGRIVTINNPAPSPYAVVAGVLPNKGAGVEVFAGLNATTGALETSPARQFDAIPALSLIHI